MGKQDDDERWSEYCQRRDAILAKLTPRECERLRKLSPNLFDDKPNVLTLEEVQRQLEATRERILELERQALAKLGKLPTDPDDDPGAPASI